MRQGKRQSKEGKMEEEIRNRRKMKTAGSGRKSRMKESMKAKERIPWKKDKKRGNEAK